VTVVRAAAAGQGYALVRWTLAFDDIQDGRLVLASPRIIPSPRSYYFVCPPSYVSLEKVAAFREWLMAQCAQAPQPDLNSIVTARQAR
jgi:LysR family glycine cleavage system transcriptional activator